MIYFTKYRNLETDSGKLAISVHGNNVGQPIQNAKVKVMDSKTNLVIEELETDSSGKTPTLTLGAPPRDYSEEKFGKCPYKDYNLVIEADDFMPVHIMGTQVLSESKAIQDVEMKYKKEKLYNSENIFVPDHVLWGSYAGKIEEEPVKKMPESSGFIVLSEVVIPEYVIVHLGKPEDTSVQDVWVTFKDYIKNVASSEIYSTWPTETLKANILAILSFTLNRVYTEWYRGKGYEFTITNSTAYDHAFNYGRNIYEEISNVVDEIFTKYITKANINQPLFTQYCDGKKVNCSVGMKQWDSMYLGKDGYSSDDILKTYYGSDIYYEEAKKVEGVPLSYGGEVLSNGSNSNAVKTIQEQLNRIANNYPAIGTNKVDGIYGDNTEKSVRKFQEVFNMTVTGAVDFSTWYQISNIYVAVTKMSELQ